MTKFLRLRIICFLLTCLIPTTSLWAQKERPPDINQILPGFIEKAKQDMDYVSDNYTHQEMESTKHIKNGVVSEIEEKIYLVEKISGVVLKKLVSKNGIAITDSEFEQKKEALEINAKLFQRYVFTLKKSETLNNIKYWVLSFRPKSSAPEEEKEDRVLNNLSGEIWITQDGLILQKLTTHLTREVDYFSPGFGFGGTVKKLEANIESTLVEGHFAISNIVVELQYSAKIFFWPINKHALITISHQKYERRKP